MADVFIVYRTTFWLIDFNGQVVVKFAAPLSRFSTTRKGDPGDLSEIGPGETSVYRAKGLWVKLKEAHPEFLAVVTKFAALDRSVLYIYSIDGRLVYQEVLPEESSSIAVLSQEDGRSAPLPAGRVCLTLQFHQNRNNAFGVNSNSGT